MACECGGLAGRGGRGLVDVLAPINYFSLLTMRLLLLLQVLLRLLVSSLPGLSPQLACHGQLARGQRCPPCHRPATTALACSPLACGPAPALSSPVPPAPRTQYGKNAEEIRGGSCFLVGAPASQPAQAEQHPAGTTRSHRRTPGEPPRPVCPLRPSQHCCLYYLAHMVLVDSCVACCTRQRLRETHG